MPPDFPGMDPWLEQPAVWPDLHNSLIAAIRDEVTDQLPDRYYMSIVEWKTADLVGVGGDDIRETYLEIHDVRDRQLVTVIEVLSPSNKLHRKTREDYEAKRREILASRTNLVEIDLLRAGEPMPLGTAVAPSDYRILVRRGSHHPRARYYAFGVRSPLPDIPIPLLPDDPEPTVELNRILRRLIDRAWYAMRVDYNRPAVPPLKEADVEWSREILARV